MTKLADAGVFALKNTAEMEARNLEEKILELG